MTRDSEKTSDKDRKKPRSKTDREKSIDVIGTLVHIRRAAVGEIFIGPRDGNVIFYSELATPESIVVDALKIAKKTKLSLTVRIGHRRPGPIVRPNTNRESLLSQMAHYLLQEEAAIECDLAARIARETKADCTAGVPIGNYTLNCAVTETKPIPESLGTTRSVTYTITDKHGKKTLYGADPDGTLIARDAQAEDLLCYLLNYIADSAETDSPKSDAT